MPLVYSYSSDPHQSPVTTTIRIHPPTRFTTSSPATTTRLWSSPSDQLQQPEDDQEDEEDEEEYGVVARLREEAESPFRPLRFFVYGGMAASGAIGALISFTGALAAYSGAGQWKD